MSCGSFCAFKKSDAEGRPVQSKFNLFILNYKVIPCTFRKNVYSGHTAVAAVKATAEKNRASLDAKEFQVQSEIP
jgi:hypothetical protein